MADSLFNKLPDIWKDLDLRVSDVVLNSECQACGYSIEEDYFSVRCPQCGKLIGAKGLLERFLLVPDAGVRRIEDLIAEFLRAHNIEKIRERFVPLFDDLTGHRWKDTKSYQWNRNRSEVAITRASYKTTDECIKDLAKEHGATYCEVVDMASKVLVESKQGTYGEDDSWYFDSDYYHPGVFQIFFSDDINITDFLEDFQYLKPMGTKWYYRVIIDEGGSDVGEEAQVSNLCYTPIIHLDAGNNTCGTVFYDIINGFYEYYNWVPEIAVEPEVSS